MNLNRRYLLAAFYALGAFTLWSCSDTLIKLSGGLLSTPQQVLVNRIFVIVILLAASFRGEGLRELKTKKPLFHLVRGLVVCVNMFTCFYAVTHLPLANFYTLAFTTPFMIALASAVFCGEHPGWGVWLAIVAGFIGVIVAMNPSRYDPVAWPWLAVVSLLVCNGCLAFYSMTIKGRGASESMTALTVYPEIICALVFLGVIAFTGDWPHDVKGVFYVALSGIVGGTANLLITMAYRRAMNALIAPFHYTQIIAGGLFGYFIWNDVPTPHLIAGVLVIIAAGLYVVWHGARKPENGHVPVDILV
jgi:drug/metabolite transporter (DMT)-like permease